MSSELERVYAQSRCVRESSEVWQVANATATANMQRYFELPVRGDKENDPAMPVSFCPGLVQARPDEPAPRYGTRYACVPTYVRATSTRTY